MFPKFVSENIFDDFQPIQRGFRESLLHALEQEEERGRGADVSPQVVDHVLDGLVVDLVGEAKTWWKKKFNGSLNDSKPDTTNNKMELKIL